MRAHLRDPRPDATQKDLARCLATASWARVPGIFKKAMRNGRAVESAPPYVPELQPIELVQNCLKTAYNTRYDNPA